MRFRIDRRVDYGWRRLYSYGSFWDNDDKDDWSSGDGDEGALSND